MAEKKKYVPFGKEWENEVMEMSKADIIVFFRAALIENQNLKAQLEQAKLIINNL